MIIIRASRVLPILFLLSCSLAEKQIKLEDIEKDNLTAAEQSKLEKHYQKFQQPSQQNVQYQLQYQTEQQPQQPSYTQQAAVMFQQPTVTYQSQHHPSSSEHSPYNSYVLPFNPAQLLTMYQNPSYSQLSSNSLGPSQHQIQQSAPQNQFLQYFSQQLQPVNGGAATSSSQPQPVVMAFSAPSLAAFQQQAAAYYQGLAGHIPQYLQAPTTQQSTPYHYYQQLAAAGQTTPPPVNHQSTPLLYHNQFVPPFQALKPSAASAASLPQYSANSQFSLQPQQFTVPTYKQQYNFAVPQQLMNSQPQNYRQAEEPPSFLTAALKESSPVSSLPQQQQYLQSLSTATPSSLQSKYLNSPQYLSQNYNTIQSSSLNSFPKFASVKPTASPALKIATQGGFVPNNPASGLNYQYSRGISG